MTTKDNDEFNYVERKLRELSILEEMNKEIHATMNLNRFLQIMVEKAVVGVNFERGLIYLLEGDFLRCAAFLDRVKTEKGSTIKNWIGFRMDETAVEVMAVKKKNTIYVEDAFNDDRMSQKFLKVIDVQEYCAVPLIGRKGVIGVLTGDKFYSGKPIFPEDIRSMELFAGHISLAVENAQLYEEKAQFTQILEDKVKERTSELALANRTLSNKMQELETLFDMSRLLSKSLQLSAVLDHILSMVRGLGYDMCAIHLPDKGRLKVAGSMGLDKAYEMAGHLALDKPLLTGIFNRPESVMVPNLSLHLKPSQMKTFLLRKKIDSALLIPLVSKKEIRALLTIYAMDKMDFQEDQQSFFSTFAQQGGVALENALIFQDILDQRNNMETLSQKLEYENTSLKEKMKQDLNRNFIMGNGSAMNEVMDLVRKVVSSTATVIVFGETGTGKELIANAIHEMGPRKHESLIKVNCAAIPDDLLESELFGHEKGAFTGADRKRVGMFQLAHKGSIFLDEIGDMSLKTQAKLLRVLQENKIQPLGSDHTVTVDVRVISATNKDLLVAIKKKEFRSDLFYRLNVFPIHLPPLRKRKEDLREFVDFFLQKYAHLNDAPVKVDPDVLNVFYDYPWPGNIRELENIVERLMIICQDGVISKNDLPKEFGYTRKNDVIKPMAKALRDFKKDLVNEALVISGGKKSAAAALLGMPRSNFSRLLKQLEIR